MDNSRLAYLSDLIKSHNHNLVKTFHKVELPNKDICKYIWQHDNDGYTIYNSNTACFIDKNSGFIYKLSNAYADNDFEKHCTLYDIRHKFGYRIEIPKHAEVIVMNNKKYLYTVVLRPNSQIGLDYHIDIACGKVNTDYFIEFVDTAVPLLHGLFEIGRRFNSGLPEVFILPTKRLHDDIGYFFFDFKRWKHPKNKYIVDNIDNLIYMMNYCNKNAGTSIDVEQVTHYIKKSWIIE